MFDTIKVGVLAAVGLWIAGGTSPAHAQTYSFGSGAYRGAFTAPSFSSNQGA